MIRLASVLWMAFVLGLAGNGSAGSARAQPADDPARGNPDEPIVIAVYGDSLAEGLWGGLYRKLQRERGWTVVNRARHSTGFARSGYYDWFRAIDGYLPQDRPGVAIVAIGLNDMQAFSLGGRRNVAFGTDSWVEHYADAVRAFAERFEEADVPLVWIGLPIMRPGTYADQMVMINGIFERVVAETDAHFLPLYPLTVDGDGGYSAYLPDTDGRSRQVRANDGIHFTSRGYDMMAGHIFEAVLEVLAAPPPLPRIELPETAAAPGAAPGAVPGVTSGDGLGDGPPAGPIQLFPRPAR